MKAKRDSLRYLSSNVDHRYLRQMLRKIETRCANPVVGNAVVDVETIGGAEVVAPVNAGGKDNIRNRSLAFLGKQRC